MEWKISRKPVDYPAAVEAMERRVADILAGKTPEMVWLLEHPPLYTAGTSAKAAGLLDKKRFPVHQTGRGGEYTYHGPGQRIAYVMLDLKKRGRQDIKCFVCDLEQWMIATLAEFGIEGFTRKGRVGVWVKDKNGESKVGAIGIRVRKWVTFHGISINVNPDLSHYSGIVPCGIEGHGVTSLEKLGVKAAMKDVDEALRTTIPAEWRDPVSN